MSIPTLSQILELLRRRHGPAVQPEFARNSGLLPDLIHPVRERDDLIIVMSGVEKDSGEAFRIARKSRIVRLLRIVDLFRQWMPVVTRRWNSSLDNVLTGLR